MLLNSAFRSRHFDKRHFGMPVILTEDDRKVSWSPHSFILPSSGLESAVTWPPALFPERIHAAVPCLKWDSLGEAKKLTERRSCVHATHPSVLSAHELLSRDKHSQHVYHPKTLCPWVLVWHDFWKVNSNIRRYHWITECPYIISNKIVGDSNKILGDSLLVWQTHSLHISRVQYIRWF